ncbi:MAG: radical SAM protein [Desulfobacterales bacterium]|nr:radical SAM protein [Desulfobacterales bacterium]
MATENKQEQEYRGFEQGPIRPPNEANSLLIRITRNCPWNRCTFCPVYKGRHFSVRPVDHVKHDIDKIHQFIELLQEHAGENGNVSRYNTGDIPAGVEENDMAAFHAAYSWFTAGMTAIFVQDANSLIIKPEALREILEYLRKKFDWVERVTSYARSHTISRIKDEDLKAFSIAGLNRIHIGLESGSDNVLKQVQKGVTKEAHIKAGQKVKAAGMEVSLYVMPGLGGKKFSEEHALETADAVSRIDPDFIRLRSLSIPKKATLYDAYINGHFEKCTDLEMAREILLFIENLDGIQSMVKSDHILNLFQEVEGRLPEDKEKMTGVIRAFLEMPSHRQCVYQVGRRLGFMAGLHHMRSPKRVAKAERICREYEITPENVDIIIDKQMRRFI